MRIRTESIVTALVCVSLLFGAIGCRLNGGAWYNPKSYSWHNPFKSNEAPSFDAEGTAHASVKPSLGAQPNVTTPPGGYTSKEDEARFFAGKKDSMVVPQYGVGTLSADGSRVASANVPPASTSGYAPTDHSYNPYATTNPYGAADNSLAAGHPTPTQYQQTNYHYEQAAPAVPANQPGAYPVSGFPENGTTSPPAYQPYNTPASSPYATPAPANANYAPYGTPESNPTYGTQTNLPPYTTQPQPIQQTLPPNNYGVPTATPYQVDPAAGGFTANPSNYQPTTPTGF
jgi:hypothetical protein